MLDVILLALKIATLVLIFLFVFWVVRSARRDLDASASGGASAGAFPVPLAAEGPGTRAGQDVWSDPARGGAWGAAGGDAGVGGAPEWQQAAPLLFGTAASGGAPVASGTSGSFSPVSSSQPTSAPYDGDEAATAYAQAGVAVEHGRPPGTSHGERADAGVGRARLVVESSPTLPPGSVFPLEGSLSLGRSPDSDVVLDDPFVSTVHARVVRRGGLVYVEDLGSTNGTYLDEQRVAQAPLRPAARLRVGETVLRYEQ